jgi:tetratricopeptide (TPR) repeat protein
MLSLDENPADPVALAARQRALHAAAWLASYQHDFTNATRLFEQSMTLRRSLGETSGETDPADLLRNAARQARAEGYYGLATTLLEDLLARQAAQGEHTTVGSAALAVSFDKLQLGLVLREQGDFMRAAALIEEALALHRAIGDRASVAFALLGLGDIARDQGDSASVREYCEPSLAILRELGMQWAIGFALNNLALAAYCENDLRKAFTLVDESIALFRSLKDDVSLSEVLITWGHILKVQGDAEAAYAALTEALQLALAVGPRLFVAAALEAIASVVVAQGQANLVVRLLAAATTLRVQMGAPVRPVDRFVVEQALAIARSTLGADVFAAVWSESENRPLEQLLSTLPATWVMERSSSA